MSDHSSETPEVRRTLTLGDIRKAGKRQPNDAPIRLILLNRPFEIAGFEFLGARKASEGGVVVFAEVIYWADDEERREDEEDDTLGYYRECGRMVCVDANGPICKPGCKYYKEPDSE